MTTRFCPLNPARLASLGWGSPALDEIETHVSSTTCCCHSPLEDLVLTGSLEGSTLLLLACKKGDLDSVARIVECWGTDVNRGAVFYPYYGAKMDGATPLYVAAKYSHIGIIRYLLEKGANVSARTSNGETPLYAAITNDVRVPIGEEWKKRRSILILMDAGADPSTLPDNRRPVWMEKSCCPEILEQLVTSGMDLNQLCPHTGNTVLHLWASRFFAKHYGTGYEEKSLRVVRFLIGNGADLQARNNIGFTPILIAALGDTMSDTSYKTQPNFLVLEFLLEQPNIRRMDKVYSLELAGSVILGIDENWGQFSIGFDYWRRALALRSMNINGCCSIQSSLFFYRACPVRKKTSPAPNHARIIEWTTEEDLQQIEQHFIGREIQALLTKFRILSTISWEAVLCYFWQPMNRYFNSVYCMVNLTHILPHRVMGSIVPALSLMWTFLEKITRFHPDEVRPCLYITVDVLNCILIDLVDHVSFLDYSEMLKTTIDVVIATTNLSNATDLDLKKFIQNERMETLQIFIYVLGQLNLRDFLNESIMDALSTFVRRDIRDQDGFNFLHHSCTDPRPLTHIQLLLQLGMDAKAVNNNRDTALHILVDKTEGNDEAARLLLEACGERCDHCDLVNNQGMTATDLLMRKRKEQNEEDRDLPDWCRKSSPKLSCLSARVIQVEKIIPYLDHERAELPPHLYAFIQKH